LELIFTAKLSNDTNKTKNGSNKTENDKAKHPAV